MSEPRAFLAALQLGDSLFPSGGFTLSHGLETLAASGLVRNGDELAEWLETTIAGQVGPSDGAAAAAAWSVAGDPAELIALDQHLLSLKLAREPREASLRTGRQLLVAAERMLAPERGASGAEPLDLGLRRYAAAARAGEAPGTHAVALGVVARAAGLARTETVLLLLHLHVAGVLGAALRLIEVDHLEAQAIRTRLAPTMAEAAEAALDRPWKEMYACAPHTELMSMLHERAPIRMFAS